jgi:hypothetical protein
VLDLDVQWPVEQGTLELIALRNHPIRSISVLRRSKQRFTIRRFKALNVKQLNRLIISNVNWDETKGLMNLALQSTCSKIVLEMHNGMPCLSPLRHKIMERVEHLELSAGEQRYSVDGEILT